MTTTTQIICRQCSKQFESYLELARHIIKEKSHKNKKWALRFVAKKPNQVEYTHVSPDPDYQPTEFGDDNREKRRRQLSGETLYANAHCPKCHQPHRILLEAEFLNDFGVWQVGGKIARLCFRCEK
jgi:hypothetical protein